MADLTKMTDEQILSAIQSNIQTMPDDVLLSKIQTQEQLPALSPIRSGMSLVPEQLSSIGKSISDIAPPSLRPGLEMAAETAKSIAFPGIAGFGSKTLVEDPETVGRSTPGGLVGLGARALTRTKGARENIASEQKRLAGETIPGILATPSLAVGKLGLRELAKRATPEQFQQASESAVEAVADIASSGLLEKPLTKTQASVEKELASTIDSRFNRAVKPSTRGVKSAKDIGRKQKNIREAITTIAENEPNLSFVDETGNIVNRTPETVGELSDSIQQTKTSIFENIDVLNKQAGATGATISLDDVADELIKLADDNTIAISSPEMAQKALNRADTLMGKNLTPEEAQKVLQQFNQKLTAYYKNPTPELFKDIQIDALIANNIRKNLDNVVDATVTGGTTQAGLFRTLKNKYKSLRSIEDDVAKGAVRSANKNVQGLIDFTDIFSAGDIVRGAASGNPALIAKGVIQTMIKKAIKKFNDPDENIKFMFNQIRRIKQ